MIEGDGDETVYASPLKGPAPTTCSGCHFLARVKDTVNPAIEWSDCWRFPKRVSIEDPATHFCGEWRSKVR